MSRNYGRVIKEGEKEQVNDENSFEIESRYEHYFDTLAIRAMKHYKYKESIELEERIILDFDENNISITLEILTASKVLKIPIMS